MFNRFTKATRRAVTAAQVEARRLETSAVGTEHLLLGLLAEAGSEPGSGTAQQLARLGVNRENAGREIERALRRGGLGDEDVAALESIGVRADQIRREVEATFGEGALRPAEGRNQKHLPFNERSKRVLERTLREATDVRSNSVDTEHLLLALLAERHGLAADVLRQLGVDAGAARERMQTALRRAS